MDSVLIYTRCIFLYFFINIEQYNIASSGNCIMLIRYCIIIISVTKVTFILIYIFFYCLLLNLYWIFFNGLKNNLPIYLFLPLEGGSYLL